MKKALATIGTSAVLLALLALSLSFSIGIVAASEVGQKANSSLCDRFPALSRLPTCRVTPPPPPTPPPTPPPAPTPTPPPAPPPSDGGRGRDLCERYLSSTRVPVPPACIPPTPPPTDACPNVSGYQAAGPCENQTCVNDGGTWNGTPCDFPPPPTVDACPNVPGIQDAGPCADDTCVADGGTWNGVSCVMPPPLTACADGVDNDHDSKADFPSDSGCSSAADNNETNPVEVYAAPQDSPYGFINQSGWGLFNVIVTDDPVLLGPISFTITTTGMEQVTKLSNVWLEGWFPSQVFGGPQDVSLVNGVGDVTFADANPISLGIRTWPIAFRATIPIEERFKVQNGATITITADPASNWIAVGATSGVEISLDSVPTLNMGALLVVPGGPPQDACADGVDNDTDGKIDFPADSGCSNSNDNDESNSGGAGGGGG